MLKHKHSWLIFFRTVLTAQEAEKLYYVMSFQRVDEENKPASQNKGITNAEPAIVGNCK